MTTAQPIAALAADLFRQRQQRAGMIVRNGGMLAAQAERHLRPWLAIACLVGADLPQIADLLAELRREVAALSGPAISDAGLRWLAAQEICPRATWVPVLAQARDAAFDRFVAEGQPAVRAAAELQRLCLALQHDVNGHHVPPYTAPAARQQAAA